MICPQCGIANDNAAKFCSGCGRVLSQGVQNASTFRAEINLPGDPEEFYQAIVGPKNQDYYLQHFSRFDADGNAGTSWNWPAFFVTFYWLLYRKMWLYALLYFFLPYLVMIPVGIAAAMAGKSANVVIGTGYLLYFAGIFLLLPMYANALYYNHCKKKISETRSTSHDMQRQLGELSGKGGTSNVAVIIVFVLFFVFIIGIMAAVAIPAYQDYTTRSRLDQAATVGTNAAESVANYYYEHHQGPSSLAQAGFVAQLPPYIKEIGVDSQSIVVTITMAAAPIEGKSLQLVPSLDANNKIIWKCQSLEIQDRLLPRQCRQKQ
jgi:Tfp pilus assembly protein PilE